MEASMGDVIDMIDLIERKEGETGLYRLWIDIAFRLADKPGASLETLYADLILEFEERKNERGLIQ